MAEEQQIGLKQIKNILTGIKDERYLEYFCEDIF